MIALYVTLNALKQFFIWLAGQPRYRSRISYADAEYFNLSVKEKRIDKAHRDERTPTFEKVRHVLLKKAVGGAPFTQLIRDRGEAPRFGRLPPRNPRPGVGRFLLPDNNRA